MSELWAVVLVCFLWGLFEATVFFLVPDLPVGAAAIWFAESWSVASLAALAGALVGGAVSYGLGRRYTAAYLAVMTRLPGHPPAFVDLVRRGFQEGGWLALLLGGVRGRPYKIYSLEAGAARRPFSAFLLAALAARGVRLVATGFLCSRWGAYRADARAPLDALMFFVLALTASAIYLAVIERRYRRVEPEA